MVYVVVLDCVGNVIKFFDFVVESNVGCVGGFVCNWICFSFDLGFVVDVFLVDVIGVFGF